MRTLPFVLAGLSWLAVLPAPADAAKQRRPPYDAAAAARVWALFRAALKDATDLAADILRGAYGQWNTPSGADSRQQHVLRWRLVFDTKDGEDYRRQLEGLGAILAVPDGEGRYRVLRKLTPPAKGAVEDLSQINRIFWVDDTPRSVESLAKALKLGDTPKHVVAFFPESLEAELQRQELAYKGLKGEDIEETRFEVRRQGNAYVTAVKDQRPKAGKDPKGRERPKGKAISPKPEPQKAGNSF